MECDTIGDTSRSHRARIVRATCLQCLMVKLGNYFPTSLIDEIRKFSGLSYKISSRSRHLVQFHQKHAAADAADANGIKAGTKVNVRKCANRRGAQEPSERSRARGSSNSTSSSRSSGTGSSSRWALTKCKRRVEIVLSKWACSKLTSVQFSHNALNRCNTASSRACGC